MNDGATRRDFLRATTAALVTGFVPTACRASTPRPEARWTPYHALDLVVDDMKTERGIRRVVWWANEFVPQANIDRLLPFDPAHVGSKAHARALPGRGKRIEASVLSLGMPSDYPKARQVKAGIARLLATGDAAVRDQLSVDTQVHAVSFDHPERGVTVPPGFQWDWVMTQPHFVADSHRQKLARAGWVVEATPSVELAARRVAGRGWPTGWMGLKPKTRRAHQYTIMPDLRIPECRAFLLDRLAAILDELSLSNVMFAGKSGWLHGAARPYLDPSLGRGGGPWLPSPYPGDSYRDANVALVREAVARFGSRAVTWTNTGVPNEREMRAQGLPAYVALSDGGIRTHFDRFYGSRESNWRIRMLEARGFFPSALR